MSISKALSLDRAGRNDEATEAIRRHQRRLLDRGGSLDETIEAFRAEARIQRHRGEADALTRACDSARQAVLLSRLPAASQELVAPTRLELGACQIRRGDPAGPQGIAGLTTHPDAGIAGWAWRLLGEAALLTERPFDAVASLLNAVAENQRGKDDHHEAGTRVLLLLAFSRAGHLEDATGSHYATAHPRMRRRVCWGSVFCWPGRNMNTGRDASVRPWGPWRSRKPVSTRPPGSTCCVASSSPSAPAASPTGANPTRPPVSAPRPRHFPRLPTRLPRRPRHTLCGMRSRRPDGWAILHDLRPHREPIHSTWRCYCGTWRHSRSGTRSMRRWWCGS